MLIYFYVLETEIFVSDGWTLMDNIADLIRLSISSISLRWSDPSYSYLIVSLNLGLLVDLLNTDSNSLKQDWF